MRIITNRNSLFVVLVSTCLSLVFSLAVVEPILNDLLHMSEKHEITIQHSLEKNLLSKGQEIWIKRIDVNGKEVDLNKFSDGVSWSFKEGALFSNRVGSKPLVLNYVKSGKLVIDFVSHSWSGTVNISNDGEEKIIDLYSQKAINKSFELELIPKNTNSSVGLGLVLSLIMLFPIFFLVNNKKYINLGFIIIQGYFASLYFGYSFISLNTVILVLILNTIVLLAVKKLTNGREFIYVIEKIKNNRSMFGVILFISIYIAITSLYNDLNSSWIANVTLLNMVMLVLLSVIIISLIILIILMFFELRNQKTYKFRSFSSSNKMEYLLWLIMSAYCFVYIYIHWPGNMSPDSIDQWGQVIGFYNLSNAHPVFFTYTIRVLTYIYNSPSVLVIFQALVFSYLIVRFFKSMYARGMSALRTLILLALFLTLPNNGVLVCTIWKDILYSYCVLSLTLNLLSIIEARKKSILSRRLILELTIGLIGVALIRHNGIVVYLCTIPALAYYAAIYNKKLIIPVIISLFTIVAFNTVFIENADVNQKNRSASYTAAIHGIARVAHDSGNLDSKTTGMLKEIMPLEKWRELYNPYNANPYYFGNDYNILQKLDKYKSSEIISMYLVTLINNPKAVIEDRLSGVDVLWNPTTSTDGYIIKYPVGIYQNEFGLQPEHSKLIEQFGNLVYSKTSSTILEALTWRTGIWIYVLMLCGLIWVYTGRYNLIIVLIPAVSNAFSLVLSMCWQDYRYVYSIFLVTYILFVYTINLRDSQ